MGASLIFRSVIAFILVGAAWGLTTPFIRKAAISYNPPARPFLSDPTVPLSKRLILKAFYVALDMLRRPSYAIPLVINLTGSIWFFLLIGKAELSLTVPIVNAMAFLFTVLGDYLADGKAVGRETWLGMGFMLGGIGLCVQSKT